MKSNLENKRLVGRLALLACAMFGFGYALVPLYEVFCELTGLNGKIDGVAQTQGSQAIDPERTIAVEFVASVDTGLPWTFKPQVDRMHLHPGEIKQVSFLAKNLSGSLIRGRAVPSVSPSIGAKHLKKIECFCFTEQRLSAGASKEMPVRFLVDPSLPKQIKTLTLAYTFFGVKSNRALDPLAADRSLASF
ncbi:MAG: cytochrome c oxidase assembly protein [Gammaproteobacteria bacterium]